MQLFLRAVPIILRLFSKDRGHLLFSNYSWNNLPKPTVGSLVSSCYVLGISQMGKGSLVSVISLVWR